MPASNRSFATTPTPPSSGSSATHEGCKIGELFAMLGQPHMLGVLHSFEAADGHPLRFTELQRQLQISPKTLSQRLRTLVEAGFLARKAYNEIPPRVEYEPTRKTDELAELFAALERWSQRNSLTVTPSVSVLGRVRPVPAPA